MLRKFVLIFLDDILVYSCDWTSHVSHLMEVFHWLCNHRLFAKLSKCEFGCTTFGYLGQVISGEGVSVDPQKIQAMKDWPLPTSVKILRGFLRLCGYYRHFVPQFATLASPLIDLLQKNVFVWTPEVTQVFHSLKEAMMMTSVLQLLDFSAPFVIQMDTSGTGVGQFYYSVVTL